MRRRLMFAFAAFAIALAAPPASAKDESFLVFFEAWSAAVDGAAADVVKAAVAAAKANPNAPVIVRGYASTIGSRQANLYISLARAQLVSDEMIEAGVAASRITRVGEGEVEFVDDPQANRRVTIIVRLP